MQSKPTTVAAYLAALPADRRAALEAVRAVVRKNIDATFEEGMQYGMIGWYVPHSVFPAGYHCDPKQPLPYMGLASQKGHMSLYMMGFYVGAQPGEAGETPEGRWFREQWLATGRKLDMGKACVRFKKIEDVALDVLGEAVRRLPAKTYIARYVAMFPEKHAAAAKKAAKGAGSAAAGSAKKTAKKTVKKATRKRAG